MDDKLIFIVARDSSGHQYRFPCTEDAVPMLLEDIRSRGLEFVNIVVA